MALVNKAFSVNVTPGMMPPIVHVSEYDVGRAYTVSILDEQGNTFTIPSGTTASIEGTLNGKVGFTQSATVSNNQVSFTLSQSMTAYSGKAWCKIKLTQNSQPIQTCAFILAVDRAGVEAETVIGAPGFEEQIQQGVADWLEDHDISSPTVEITEITGGNRVTFYDADHSQGQSIDVMDGEDGFQLPQGGVNGQSLVSDGNGGARWTSNPFPTAFRNAMYDFLSHLSGVFDDQNGDAYIEAVLNSIGVSTEFEQIQNRLYIATSARVTVVQSGATLRVSSGN